jgi:hypothetical protein
MNRISAIELQKRLDAGEQLNILDGGQIITIGSSNEWTN